MNVLRMSYKGPNMILSDVLGTYRVLYKDPLDNIHMGPSRDVLRTGKINVLRTSLKGLDILGTYRYLDIGVMLR
jgi:hypothetical protein